VLRLRVPTRADFPTRRAWLADPGFMAFNAGWDLPHPGYDRATGCVAWPEPEWDAFETRIARPAAVQGYFFVRDDASAEDLGHAHYSVDEDGAAEIGLNLVPSARGRGLGAEVLGLLLDRVWSDTPAVQAVNEFEDTRLPAVRVHRRCGFEADPWPRELAGRAVRTWRLARPA